MEKVIDLVDVGSNLLETRTTRVFTYETYPFEFKQIPLPLCNTGYVYFLVSLNNRRLTYGGQTLEFRKDYFSAIVVQYSLLLMKSEIVPGQY